MGDRPMIRGNRNWKVEKGIRMSGRPGFKGILTETRSWHVPYWSKKTGQVLQNGEVKAYAALRRHVDGDAVEARRSSEEEE